ncbi:fatty acid desaturase [Geomicrobium sediminis]|uniref:Omega-6 fatty acid desaturase (Delta-12 desaturase) n=1 Tax=Geomicrobium sediminis TaxID=1347788 RepID=A0ABS2P6K1_9BACL|nr:fatty acid desaturase [Geomicrobium sediminis]MBM7630929.1 omega-6 fatty acid desaturase (delta-12 desaturase) [Geomicrobium sediminis]
MSREKQKALKQSVAPYATSNTKVGIFQLVNTLLPFLFVWFLAYQSLSISIWLSLVFSIIAAGFVVRIFIIFHDCTHASFFKNRTWNRIVGNVCGVLTHFPFEKWKHSHAIHHATSGNLDKRGVGDIWVMTIDEYKEASKFERLKYRLYRNPLILFGLGPLYLFLVDNRINKQGAKRKEKYNTYLTNVCIVFVYGVMISLIGWQAFLLVQLPIMYLSGVAGIWLFYVQHQFEDSYYENDDEWDFVKAAVDGSSYYKLPKVIQWMTGNIGYHHVHHLSPKVPNYHLEKTHDNIPPLQTATTITLKKSLESIRFRLYDEKNQTFVTFKEMKQSHRPQVAASLKSKSKQVEQRF